MQRDKGARDKEERKDMEKEVMHGQRERKEAGAEGGQGTLKDPGEGDLEKVPEFEDEELDPEYPRMIQRIRFSSISFLVILRSSFPHFVTSAFHAADFILCLSYSWLI